MELFSNMTTEEYTRRKISEINDEIQRLSDREIISCDFSEWINYYYSKNKIDLGVIYEDNMTTNIEKAKVKRYNQFYRSGSGVRRFEKEYYELDGFKVTYKIPYDGNQSTLFLIPSQRVLTRFIVEGHQAPSDVDVGYFVLAFEFTSEELKNNNDAKSFVDSKFNHEFSYFKKMIEYVNNDLDKYNKSLKTNVSNFLENRKQKADDYVFISEKLNIPLELDKNAPNIVPIPLKRIERPLPKSPLKNKQIPKEYSISEEDYKNILNIIHNNCTMMENTASTFCNLDEEGLRDIVIGALGTHYVNSVTGETFRKNGKTDILVQFESKAAFIAECKIWSGVKNLDNARTQLFGYSTWKDTKLALIIFNKNTKSFMTIKKRIEEWISESGVQKNSIHPNVWRCKIYREDVKQEVELCIMVYDVQA